MLNSQKLKSQESCLRSIWLVSHHGIRFELTASCWARLPSIRQRHGVRIAANASQTARLIMTLPVPD